MTEQETRRQTATRKQSPWLPIGCLGLLPQPLNGLAEEQLQYPIRDRLSPKRLLDLVLVLEDVVPEPRRRCRRRGSRRLRASGRRGRVSLDHQGWRTS